MRIAGPAVYDGKRPQKLDVSDEDDAKFTLLVADGWMAEMQHHFVSARPCRRPASNTNTRCASEGDHSLASYRGPLKSVSPGGSASFK